MIAEKRKLFFSFSSQWKYSAQHTLIKTYQISNCLLPPSWRLRCWLLLLMLSLRSVFIAVVVVVAAVVAAVIDAVDMIDIGSGVHYIVPYTMCDTVYQASVSMWWWRWVCRFQKWLEAVTPWKHGNRTHGIHISMHGRCAMHCASFISWASAIIRIMRIEVRKVCNVFDRH